MLKFIEKLFARNVLYYPGCLTHFAAKDLEENYKKILSKIGIDFIMIPEFVCCGSPALNAGYKEDFEVLVKKNKELFKKYGVKKIITNCPGCYHIFKTYYDINVEHITVTISKNLKKITTKKEGKISYHDPCHLGRKSNIYDEPRNILRHIGFEVVELEDNRENALCCGGGAGLKTNYPELASSIAKKRLSQAKTKKIITTCQLCYKHLKENAKDIEVYELSEVLV